MTVRMLWLLAPLAGCNLLFHAEPSEGAADDDVPHDGRGVVIDASCTSATGVDEIIIEGTWFTADRASQRAVLFDDGVLETVGNVDTHAMGDYVQILEPKPPGIENYDAPRLSPGGEELFVAMFTSVAKTLGRATRTGPTWSTPQPVVLEDETGAVIDDLGIRSTSPPTTTTPRRMLVSASFDVLELEEMDPLRWRGIRRYTNAMLGSATIDDAMLVPDGTQLVYMANTGIRMSTRTGIDASFGASQLLWDPGSTAARSGPFYTVDCQKHLYYAKTFNIHHVVLP